MKLRIFQVYLHFHCTVSGGVVFLFFVLTRLFSAKYDVTFITKQAGYMYLSFVQFAETKFALGDLIINLERTDRGDNLNQRHGHAERLMLGSSK